MKKENRLKASAGRWMAFVLWTAVFIGLVVWTHSVWWLLPIPFSFDIHISRFIPWRFWKSWKNKFFRTVMDWVDAIVYALVAVYFVFLFLFQNYQIPSSSLEKSLLVGDFLFVSKAAYGPRMPFTPFSFPLAQHTMPLSGNKSYIEKPQWDYKRLKGTGEIQRKDIVVFNFPTGDTVATRMENPDFYTLRYMLSKERGISEAAAEKMIRSTPRQFGEITWRPVDRRENYVKRCIGLPGDTLQIIDNQVYVNGLIVEDEPGVQYNYFVQTKGGFISERQFEVWGISRDDRYLLPDGSPLPDLLGFIPGAGPVYHFPATREVIEKVRKASNVNDVRIEPDRCGGFDIGGYMFPLDDANTWSRDHYGPLWIPAKGSVIPLTEENVRLYGRAIRVYEGHELVRRDGRYLLDGQPSDSYTFAMDYYWMMGDNRHNSADSRCWGFVPEDHIVGKPLRVWLSIDKDKSWFHGKIRWKRFLHKAS